MPDGSTLLLCAGKPGAAGCRRPGRDLRGYAQLQVIAAILDHTAASS
jgi:hypothetical protein